MMGETLTPVSVPNDPVQMNESGSESGSLDAAALRFTNTPALDVASKVRSMPASATGGLFADPCHVAETALLLTPKRLPTIESGPDATPLYLN
jgi:hypothetical protein